MAHFRKITVDEVTYEYRITSTLFFLRNKELKLKHSIPCESIGEKYGICEVCGYDCGCCGHDLHRITPKHIADYIRAREFHKPLQIRKPELIRPEKKVNLKETIRINRKKYFYKSKREEQVKQAKKDAKKNKTAPKKKASSNGQEWVQAARVNRARERYDEEEKQRLGRHREHW